MFRTSEFWMGIVTVLGQAGVMFGFWKQDDWNAILFPALTYVVARITSKVVKAV